VPKLPHISGDKAIKVFEDLEFKIVKRKGSHVVLRKGNKGCVVPLHKELAIGTLQNAIKQADITIEMFISNL